MRKLHAFLTQSFLKVTGAPIPASFSAVCFYKNTIL